MYGVPGWFEGMGIAGVAWATIIIQLASLLYMIHVLRSRDIPELNVWG